MKIILKRGVVALLVIATVVIGGIYFYIHRPIDRIPSDEEDVNTITFLAIGDQGEGGMSQWQVAHAMEKFAEKVGDLDFVAFLGDNFYSKEDMTTTSDLWKTRFENVYQGEYLSAIPFYAVLGNHDQSHNAAAEIEYAQKNMGSNRWRMPSWHYSEDFGAVDERPVLRIVFIDTCLEDEALAKEADFIREQFADTPHSPIWKIVVGHYPVRNYGKHGEIQPMLDIIKPALEQANVDLYLSGHDHDQQVIADDGDPLYFISGVGGAELYTAVTQSHPDLLFSRSTYGFVALSIDKDTLSVGHYDLKGEPEVQYKIDRKCSLGTRQCLQLMQPKP